MELSGDYPHLHPAARAWADEDAASRVIRIRTDRWIGYARAEAALAAIEDVLSFPKRTRMPNLLLVGPTNNGKTMIVEKFRRSHPMLPTADTQDGVARCRCSKCRCLPVLMNAASSPRSSTSLVWANGGGTAWRLGNPQR